MYGELSSEEEPLEWSWASDQLRSCGTYWVVARSDGIPHPRPVWGVWSTDDEFLHLSVGSPVLVRQFAQYPDVAVHLGSGTDVVIVEGRRTGSCTDTRVLRAYNEKYDWNYTVEQYGPLMTVAVRRVLAWQSAGWAGRQGFQRTGRWEFSTTGGATEAGPQD